MALQIGTSVGHWTVASNPERRGRGYFQFCKCICGTEKWIDAGSLTKGLSKSCGCKRSEKLRAPSLGVKPLSRQTLFSLELIAKGYLPPADAMSASDGEPCWNFKTIAEILGVDAQDLLAYLRNRSKSTLSPCEEARMRPMSKKGGSQ